MESSREIKHETEMNFNTYFSNIKTKLIENKYLEEAKLANKDYFIALNYMMSILSLESQTAIEHLALCNENELKAIPYGLLSGEVKLLDADQAHEWIEIHKRKWCKSPNDLFELNKQQIKVLNELYHYGLSEKEIKANGWLKTELQADALITIVKEKFVPINNALEQLKPLTEEKLSILRNEAVAPQTETIDVVEVQTKQELSEESSSSDESQEKEKEERLSKDEEASEEKSDDTDEFVQIQSHNSNKLFQPVQPQPQTNSWSLGNWFGKKQ